MLEQRRMEATKRELERTIEDINHPNQVQVIVTIYDLNLVQLSYQGLELKDMQTLL